MEIELQEVDQNIEDLKQLLDAEEGSEDMENLIKENIEISDEEQEEEKSEEANDDVEM